MEAAKHDDLREYNKILKLDDLIEFNIEEWYIYHKIQNIIFKLTLASNKFSEEKCNCVIFDSINWLTYRVGHILIFYGALSVKYWMKWILWLKLYAHWIVIDDDY